MASCLRAVALAALLAVLPWLSGCAADPTPQEIKAAKAGPRPTSVQATVRRYVQERAEALGGPVKLGYVGKVYKCWQDPGPLVQQFPRRWGWGVTIVYQGPDSRGGALPYTYRDVLFFQNGKYLNATNANTIGEIVQYSLADGLSQQGMAQRAAASGAAPAEEDGGDEGTPDYLQPVKKKKKH